MSARRKKPGASGQLETSLAKRTSLATPVGVSPSLRGRPQLKQLTKSWRRTAVPIPTRHRLRLWTCYAARPTATHTAPPMPTLQLERVATKGLLHQTLVAAAETIPAVVPLMSLRVASLLTLRQFNPRSRPRQKRTTALCQTSANPHEGLCDPSQTMARDTANACGRTATSTPASTRPLPPATAS